MRAFIAVEMPPPLQRRMEGWQRRLARQLVAQQLDRCVRWTAAGNLHLTLRFLGEIDESQCSLLAQALTSIAAHHAPLSLRIEGLGCFPNMSRPNVIWCGIQGELAALARLQADVERVVHAAGIAADEKAFKPHLTIGRTQRSATGSQLRAVGAVVAELAAVATPPKGDDCAAIQELLLLESELTPSGPIYTPLGVFPLAAT
ncbi:MAG: RNA 2',3'-cyclic phosphodiesterase [Caldilinea sp.]